MTRPRQLGRVVVVVGLLVSLGVGAVSANAPPEAEAGLDQTVDRGDTVLLDAGGSWDPDGDVVATTWSIRAPNGTHFLPECRDCTETAFVPQHLGRYNVTVTVTDDDGATRSDTLFVTVEPPDPPTVSLTRAGRYNGSHDRVRAQVRAGAHNLTRLVWWVEGTRVETQSIAGRTATSVRPIERPRSGARTVTVTATDWAGHRGADAISLTPANASSQPPTIAIQRAPTSLAPGEAGRFVATATDPDGGPVSIDWDPGTATGENVTLAFASTGVLTVTATATDDEGQTARDAVLVRVERSAPPLGINISSYPATLGVGEAGRFEATVTNASGQPVAIDWTPAGNGTETTLRWNRSGSYRINATAVASDGRTATDSVWVNVLNCAVGCNDPPQVSITQTPSEPVRPGETVQFAADASDPNGDRVTLRWQPTGTTGGSTAVSWSGTGQRTVAVTATDEHGLKAMDTARVTVRRRSLGNEPPSVSIVAAPNRTLEPGESGAFVAVASDPDGDPISLSWNGGRDAGTTARLSWDSEGRKNVTVVARDGNGGVDRDSVQVTVDAGFSLSIAITDSPDGPLEVGENGTFRAVATATGGQPVPIVWQGGSLTGNTVTLDWNTPGDPKIVTATAIWNATVSASTATTVTVRPQSGLVADFTMSPQCHAVRDHLCDAATTTTKDPVRFSAAAAKSGGTAIESYAWSVDGTLVSNDETFERSFAAKHRDPDAQVFVENVSEYEISLTVQGEYGNTDTSTKTLRVRQPDARPADISLLSDLEESCGEYADRCSWDPDQEVLKVVRGATTGFRVSGRSDHVTWWVPWMAAEDGSIRGGRTLTSRWEEPSASGYPVTARLYASASRDTVVGVDSATVEVLSRQQNHPPDVSIDDIRQVCAPEGTRLPGGCTLTDAVDITYSVSDPDDAVYTNQDVYSVHGHLVPENQTPVSIASHEGELTDTVRVGVSADGLHAFRLRADDGDAVAVANETFFVVNATEEGDGGGGLVVDGDWSMDIRLSGGAGGWIQAWSTIECTIASGADKCPGRKISINWGDGSQELITSNYSDETEQSWELDHLFQSTRYPTVTVSVLKNDGQAIQVLQRHLDLADMDVMSEWKFDSKVRADKKPSDHTDPDVWYRDKEELNRRPVGSPFWLDSVNSTIRSGEHWDIVSKDVTWISTGQTRTSLTAPYTGPGERWVKIDNNAGTTRTTVKHRSRWYDTQQSGLKYILLSTEDNKLQGTRFRVTNLLNGRTELMDYCPDGARFRCQQVEDGSGTDYEYRVYHTATLHEYRKQSKTVDYKVQKFTYPEYDYVWERWVAAG